MISFEEVQKRFPEARLSRASGHAEVTVHCPKPHKKGGRWKLQINVEPGHPDEGQFYCHDCGFKGGNAQNEFFDGTSEMLDRLRIESGGIPSTAVTQSATENVVPIYYARPGEVSWGKNKLRAPGEVIPIQALEAGHPAIEYLEERGIDLSELNTENGIFPTYYCTRGYFRSMRGMLTTTGRICWPVIMSQDVVGWQARYIDYERDGKRYVWGHTDWIEVGKDEEGNWRDKDIPKYYTMPGMSISTSLYNFDQSRKYDHCVCVEGILDVIQVGPEALGTFGRKGEITQHQRRLIKAYWNTAIILRDSDVNPQNPKFQQVLSDLDCIRVVHLKLEGYKDPGSANRREIWDQIAQAADVRQKSHTLTNGNN